MISEEDFPAPKSSFIHAFIERSWKMFWLKRRKQISEEQII